MEAAREKKPLTSGLLEGEVAKGIYILQKRAHECKIEFCMFYPASLKIFSSGNNSHVCYSFRDAEVN